MVEAPGENDPEKLKAVIGKTAKLTFQMVDSEVAPEDIAAGRIPPDDETAARRRLASRGRRPISSSAARW